MRVWLRRFLPLLAIAFLAADLGRPAHADVGGWEVGVGAGVRPDYEGSEDYDFLPIGTFRVDLVRESFIDFSGTKGSGRAARLRVNLVSDSLVQFGPVAEFRWGRGDVKNDQVDAMKNIDPALELGGFFGFDEQGWSGGIVVVADVTESYKGVYMEGTCGYRYAFTDWFTAGAGLVLTWGSDGYMETYFGVNDADSQRSGLDTYETDSGFKDFGEQLFARVALPGIEGLGLMGVFSHNLLLDNASDSPIVDDVGSKQQFFGGVLLTYER